LFAGYEVDRPALGVPQNWSTVKNWITELNSVVYAEQPPKPKFSIKCPEIAELKNYEKIPNNSFWNTFPKNLEKETCNTAIDVKKFIKLIDENKANWSYQQKTIANKAIKTLKFGSKICFKKGENAKYFSKNGNSSFKHGKLITDTIATWVKKGHVLGPFATPPFKDLNVSP